MQPSWQSRYLIPILFVVLLGVGLTTAVSYVHTRKSVEDLAFSRMTQALLFLDRDVTEKIRNVKSDVAIWSREEVFRLALARGYLARSARTAASKRLAERVFLSGYDRALLVGPGGDVVCSTSPEMEGRWNMGDRASFQAAMRGEVALETVRSSRYDGQAVLGVAGPIRNLDDGVEGVMAVVVGIPAFARSVLDGVRLGATGGAFILDGSGRVLAAPSWKGEGRFEPGPDAVAALKENASGKLVRYMSGKSERVAVSAVNPETGWIIVVEQDAAEVLSPASRLAALNGIISLAVLVLVWVALEMLRRAMKRLGDSEARYRILTETTPVGIVTLDARGKPVYLNQRAQDILRIDPERPDATDWMDQFETREENPIPRRELPMFRPHVADAVWIHADRTASETVTLWFRLPDGSRRALYLACAPLLDGGATMSGVVAAIEDITERVRIQEMMVQTEKMLSVGGLAAGMAHEINNPLASILQALQVVRRRLDPSSPVNVSKASSIGLDLNILETYMNDRGLNEFLDGIREAGTRAARIVTNMLGFARKSSGQYALCDLGALLDRTVELAGGDYDLKQQYDFKRIAIVREYDPALAQVECQSMEIEQVFFNIIKNAAQAMRELPEDAESPSLVLRTRRSGRMVEAEIEDNGPGMPEEIRRRVFEPFYTTKGVGDGTGLGLSVAYFIISENHKGTISVESSPGKGTRFTVRLPFKRVG